MREEITAKETEIRDCRPATWKGGMFAPNLAGRFLKHEAEGGGDTVSQCEAESSASKVTLATEATGSMFRHFKVDQAPSFRQAKRMCGRLAAKASYPPKQVDPFV